MDYYGFDDNMFNDQKIDFHQFKTGEHQFRILPPYAPGKLFYQVDLHWGFTDVNGKKKPIVCTKWKHKQCAICDEVDKLKGQIETLKAAPTANPEQVAENKQRLEELEKRMSDIKRKSTYLWNVMSADGKQKVLQLSWNGHDPLHQKVKFMWENRKINVTDPNNNYGMWVQRSGDGARTRYQYEVLEQNVRKLENLKPLTDLSVVYKEITPAEIKEIVETGCVGTPQNDPNQRDFTAEMPSGIPAGNQAQASAPAAGATQHAPTPSQNRASSPSAAANAPLNSAPVTGETLPVSPTLNAGNQANVDAETENLMRMLQS